MDHNLSRRSFINVIEVAGVTVTLAGCTGSELSDFEPNSSDMATTQESDGTEQPDDETDETEGMSAGTFVVEFDGEQVDGWQAVSIPSVSVEHEEYREGGEDAEERTVAGQPTYDDLEMEREMINPRFHNWMQAIIEGRMEEATKDVRITVQPADREQGATRWEFTQCWPKNYDPPDLDASADGEVSTESLTVAFDKMIRAE